MQELHFNGPLLRLQTICCIHVVVAVAVAYVVVDAFVLVFVGVAVLASFLQYSLKFFFLFSLLIRYFISCVICGLRALFARFALQPHVAATTAAGNAFNFSSLHRLQVQ